MKESTERRYLSIRGIIIISFISIMIITISGIGYLVFSNWISSAKLIMKNIADDMNQEIYHQIDMFMSVPEYINETNHKLIENGILDLSDEVAQDRFFAGVLSSQDIEIYSFSYGTVNGEYYGARRNESGVIEIMRNNTDTGGNSWYYSVNEDLTAGKLVVQAGKFDPRTRAWYKAAEEAGGPVFSPLYKHFVMDDLTVSAAWPVYNSNGELQGVLGTHMLLSGIGSYLEDIVKNNNGYAFIIEKDTGELVANSLGSENFTVLKDGSLERYTLNEIDNPMIRRVYEHYNKEQNTHFLIEGEDESLYINIEEYHKEGLNWLVISAVPESLLIAEVSRNIKMTIILVIIAVLLSVVIYYAITIKLMKPISNLLKVADDISSGNLSDRAKITRNDEIGRISRAFNNMADRLNYLINNLEETVKTRTEDLEANKDQLRLILDSTAEGIYGIDIEGNCTFCNISCIKLLGYSSQNDLLGKNMHWQIHHSKNDGTAFPFEECKIITSIRQGEGTHVDDEVFWKADNTFLYVEYHAYPQIKNGKVIGAVITFMDITERRKREEEISYLSYHDTLTGLHNRRSFEESLKKMDIPDSLPLSVIFADINGLKMTNDIFGHAAGDALIKKSSEILINSCRENDIIARVGGDEFIILLPNTNSDETERIISLIKAGFSGARIAAIKCSISLGSDTKIIPEQSIKERITIAENAMYKDKTMNRKSINKDIIDNIIETLHDKSPKEKQHSIAVSELCGKIGTALNLPNTDIIKLKQAGYLHDIGKIVLDKHILHESSADEDFEEIQQHSVIGYRILNLFDDTLDLAEAIYSHHERWDGKGYPKRLKGEEIPIISRIISIAETYERVLSAEYNMDPISKDKALQLIKEGAGKQFDPQIVGLFVQIMEKD